MDLISQNNIIDRILNSYKPELGNDFEQYRNHVYRVYNFALPYVKSTLDIEILSVATAFHDLGIWTNRTFDYLKPSIYLAKQYALNNHLNIDSIIQIETIINEHHKLTKIKTSLIAEIFRQADLVDLSLGLIRHGRKGQEIRMVRNFFPNKGFHVNLLKLFLKNLLKKPWKPLPMYKF